MAVSGTWFDQDTDEIGMETLESYGELSSGRVYNNEYHMLLTIRREKISAVREYHDTQHKVATWS